MTELVESSSDFTQLTSPIISFINSQKGKLLLVIDDYIFKLNRETETTKYWVCTFNGCLSKVHTTLDNQLIQFLGQHDHSSDKEKIEVRQFREKVKERAVKETTPVPQIYEEECARMMLSFAAITILPSECEMNSSLNKARRAITPLIPTTQLFDVPEPFNKTLRNGLVEFRQPEVENRNFDKFSRFETIFGSSKSITIRNFIQYIIIRLTLNPYSNAHPLCEPPKLVLSSEKLSKFRCPNSGCRISTLPIEQYNDLDLGM